MVADEFLLLKRDLILCAPMGETVFGRWDYDLMVDPNRGIAYKKESDKEDKGKGNNHGY